MSLYSSNQERVKGWQLQVGKAVVLHTVDRTYFGKLELMTVDVAVLSIGELLYYIDADTIEWMK